MTGTLKTLALLSIITPIVPLAAACAVEPEVSSTNQEIDAIAFGFAWSNQLTGVFNPSATWAASTGGAITISNMSTGHYTVTFAGLGGPSGNAQVVAHGTDSTRCKVQSWFQSGTNEIVNVLCHTPADAFANSRFVVRYGRAGGSYPSAYLWADQPSAASYTPTSSYSFNSTGVANTITRSAVGSYTVHLPGLGGFNGSVLVTGHGNSSSHCNLVSWGSAVGTRNIEVRCWSGAGALADSTFSLAFDGSGITGYNDVGAYAWANDPTNAAYVPSPSYSYNSGLFACDAGANSAGKLGLGRTFLRHTTIGSTESTVHVTSRRFVAAPNYCKVESWNPWNSTGVEVKVRCFDATGAPVDSEYAESYYTTGVQGPC